MHLSYFVSDSWNFRAPVKWGEVREATLQALLGTSESTEVPIYRYIYYLTSYFAKTEGYL
jgi:hypothetical protein